MKVIPLASGSSGNSYLIRGNGTAILADAGLSGKEMTKRLDEAGTDPGSLTGILVSHAHLDHIKGVGVLARKFKLPVYINKATWKAAQSRLGKIDTLEFFETGRIFRIGEFRIHPFSVPHDCVDPVGFRITRGTERLAVATDLGAATGLVAGVLAGAQVLILESNHDPDMLRDGPYPWDLKQRVRSRLGHLSNGDCAKLLQRVISDELKAVVLGHISETNNLPEIALHSARSTLDRSLGEKVALSCAPQDRPGPSVEW